jgi:hypothetical protein
VKKEKIIDERISPAGLAAAGFGAEVAVTGVSGEGRLKSAN